MLTKIVLLLVCLFGIAHPTFSRAGEPISPIPQQAQGERAKVQLGELLFSSPLLSGRQGLSCASCHDIENLGGSDGHSLSIGVHGKTGIRRTPSIFNVSLNFVQFWDGRADTLEAQLNDVLHDQNGLASDWPVVLQMLNTDPRFNHLFNEVFGKPPDRASVTESVVSYERTLITPDSRFDRYLRGDHTALTADEFNGYTLFKRYGCVSCHQGVNVGGNMFEPLGIIGNAGDYFRNHGEVTHQDYGRYNVTGDASDMFVFKVPSLRNVALRAPYFNDGSMRTLPEAVASMAQYQLGRPLSEKDIALIVKFLNTLTGTYKGKQLTR